jgi:hypothetical protein
VASSASRSSAVASVVSRADASWRNDSTRPRWLPYLR